MIDTISFLAIDVGDHSFNFENLDRPYSLIQHQNGVVLNRGMFKNFNVRETSKGIFINGSIPKYIFNENLTIPSLAQIEDALNEIANELNFNLQNTSVYRIDIGYNFRLNHNVKNYLGQFGNLVGFSKMNINDLETLRYVKNDKTKQLLFYHKLLEMKANRVKIPSEFKDLDNFILRYELRLMKRLKVEFRLDNVRANMLYDKDFVSLLIEKWHDHYFNIHKTSKVRFRKYVFKKTLKLKNALAAFGLQSLGYDNVLNRINMVKKDYDSTHIARLKKLIKDLSTNTDATVSYPLIKELDEKVEDVFNNYITRQG